MKILILTTEHWDSWEEKTRAVKQFWQDHVDFEIEVRNVGLQSTIQWEEWSDGVFFVDRAWMARNFSGNLDSYDIVCFHTAPPKNRLTPGGVSIGKYYIQLFSKEKDKKYSNDGTVQDLTTRNLSHEISHAMFNRKGIEDRTHDYFYGYDPTRVFDYLFPDSTSLFSEEIEELMREHIDAIKEDSSKRNVFTMLRDLFKKVDVPVPEEITVCTEGSEKSAQTYTEAIKKLARDASPRDRAPDRLGCAESVNEIVKAATGSYVTKRHHLSTYWMYRDLENSDSWERVSDPIPGDIIISPTGFGNGNISNGHVGIMGEGGYIMSSNSANGLWEMNYNIDQWRERYRDRGGFPVAFFRRVV